MNCLVYSHTFTSVAEVNFSLHFFQTLIGQGEPQIPFFLVGVSSMHDNLLDLFSVVVMKNQRNSFKLFC